MTKYIIEYDEESNQFLDRTGGAVFMWSAPELSFEKYVEEVTNISNSTTDTSNLMLLSMLDKGVAAEDILKYADKGLM